MQLGNANAMRKTIMTLAIVCAVLQLALAPNIGIADGRASFAVVFTACIAFLVGGRRGVIGGFCAGLFFDLTTTGPIGLMAFELTVMAYLLGSAGRNRLAEDMTGSVQEFAIAAFVVSFAYNLAMLMVGQASSFVDVLFLRTLPTVVLDCIAFVPFVYFLSRTPSGPRMSTGRRGGHFSTKGL